MKSGEPTTVLHFHRIPRPNEANERLAQIRHVFDQLVLSAHLNKEVRKRGGVEVIVISMCVCNMFEDNVICTSRPLNLK